MTPTRLLILQRLTAIIEATTAPVGAPAVSLAGAVFRGRSLLGADIPRPAVSLLENPRPDQITFAGVDMEALRGDWVVLVQGLAEDDKSNPSDPAYWLAAAVEVALSRINATRGETGRPLFPDEYMLGGLLTRVDIGHPVVRPPEREISSSAYFFLPLRLGVAGLVGEPYTAVD